MVKDASAKLAALPDANFGEGLLPPDLLPSEEAFERLEPNLCNLCELPAASRERERDRERERERERVSERGSLPMHFVCIVYDEEGISATHT